MCIFIYFCIAFLLSDITAVKHGQLQHVTELAEKYKDFPVLIQLCEELNNKMKLKEYISLFAAQVHVRVCRQIML